MDIRSGGFAMIIVLDENDEIARAQVKCFEREGLSALTLDIAEFEGWFMALAEEEVAAAEAFLIGVDGEPGPLVRMIRSRSKAPAIAVGQTRRLDETLRLFSMGFDDVVYRPVHVREIMARAGAAAGRGGRDGGSTSIAGITFPAGGGDPIVGGDALNLPRRERRILDCLARSRGGWVNKRQLFNHVYGVLNDVHDESVVESHICRLRKRLRLRLGDDPIESQRYLGYRLVDKAGGNAGYTGRIAASAAQVTSDAIAISSMMAAGRRGAQ